MTQPDFIWTSRQIHVEGPIIHDGDEIIVTLRNDLVKIVHNWTRPVNEQVTVSFMKDKNTYFIENESQLKDVCCIHLTNTDDKAFIQELRDYCKENLHKEEQL